MSTLYASQGVYRIRNLYNNKEYVGSASNLKIRIKQWAQCMRRGTNIPNKELEIDLHSVGIKAFRFSVIELVPWRAVYISDTQAEIEYLLAREQFHLSCTILRGVKVYNRINPLGLDKWGKYAFLDQSVPVFFLPRSQRP